MASKDAHVQPRLLVVQNERALGGAELPLLELIQTLESYPVAVRCLVSQDEMRRRLDGLVDVTVARIKQLLEILEKQGQCGPLSPLSSRSEGPSL